MRRLPVIGGGAAAVSGIAGGLLVLGGAPQWSSNLAWTPPEPTATASVRSSAVAVRLLESAARAADSLTYSGETTIVDAGRAMRMRVTHRPGRGTTLVLLEATGTGGEQWIPDGEVGSPAVPDELAAGVTQTSLLAQNYRLELGGVGTVAGRATTEVLALRSDGSLAAVYQVDRRTGLLLARITFGSETLSAEFANITIGTSRHAATVPLRAAPVSAATLARLRLAGWICRDALPGGFRLFDLHVGLVGQVRTLHLVYSDGLTTVSLFEQAGRLDPRRLTGFSQGTVGNTTVWWRSGRPAQRVWQSGGFVVTAMGEVPSGVLDDIVRVIPGSRVDDGGRVADRLRRGVHRVLSVLHLSAV